MGQVRADMHRKTRTLTKARAFFSRKEIYLERFPLFAKHSLQ